MTAAGSRMWAWMPAAEKTSPMRWAISVVAPWRDAAVTRTFGDDDPRRPSREKCGCRTRNNERMGIDCRSRFVLHHVWLQQHALSGYVDAEFPETSADDCCEVVAVRAGMHQRDRGFAGELELASVEGWSRPARRGQHRSREDTQKLPTVQSQAGCVLRE